jgi:uncharacterized protein
MKLRFGILISSLIILLLNVCSFARAEDDLLKWFNYDNKQPLRDRWAGLEGHPYYNLYKVVYVSDGGEKVPALYFEPRAGTPPFPCIIMQHGYSGSKTDVKSMGLLDFIKEGYAVFAIDAQYHGERKIRGKDIFSPDIDSDAKAMLQTVIDLRRAVDLLETRKNIDSNRISYFGVSMGAILGSIFCGVESRVKAPVLVVGGGGWETLIQKSKIGPAMVLRKYIERGQLGSIKDLARKLEYLEPLNFVWRISPRPVLLINNKHDTIVPTEANKLLQEKTREPKKIVWLDGVPGDPTGHIPPLNQVISLAIEWWKKYL